ncbi:signal transduction histidine kinase [Paraburkholderia sp. WC7.3g]
MVAAGLFSYLYFSIGGFAVHTFDRELVREQGSVMKLEPATVSSYFDHHTRIDELGMRPFGLFDRSGRLLAGSFPDAMPDVPGYGRVFALRTGTSSNHREFRCIASTLALGRLGVQCQDVRELDDFREQLLGILVSVGSATVLIGFLTAAFAGVSSTRRIREVTITTQAIVQGDLSRRLPVHGSFDDINQLNSIVNSMLDDMERLVHEVKDVCNAIAHDLRTPLMRLLGGLEGSLARGTCAKSYQQAIEDAIENTGDVLSRFNAIMRIGELEVALREEGFEAVDLRDVVREVMEYYEPVAEERRIHITTSDWNEVLILGDTSLLFEAIGNVIENAIKYSFEGGVVTVRILDHGANFSLEIADQGPGIPVHERSRVFKRFYRATLSRGATGTGLGLSVTAAIVRMHKMTIGIPDTAQGCTFVITGLTLDSKASKQKTNSSIRSCT